MSRTGVHGRKKYPPLAPWPKTIPRDRQKTPEDANGGKAAVAAAPRTVSMKGIDVAGMGENPGSQTQRLWI